MSVRAPFLALALGAVACGPRAESATPTTVILPPPVASAAAPAAPPAPCVTLAACTAACARGEKGACVRQARVHEHGIGVPRDRRRAAQMLDPLCQSGDLEACARLANLYTYAADFPDGYPRGLALSASTCDAGSARACEGLGWMFRMGAYGAVKDLSRSRELATRAAELHRAGCDRGDLPECVAYAYTFEVGERDNVHGQVDVPRAAALYERLCNGGSAEACSSLANLVKFGRKKSGAAGEPWIIPPDRARALKLEQKGCDGGSPGACHWLAGSYWQGDDVPRDVARALRLDESACASWFELACRGLAERFETGALVDKDPARARALYELSCGLGGSPSCKRAAALAP